MSVPFPYARIKFDKKAKAIDPGDAELRALLDNPAAKPTDLIVISHGWNNDMAEAQSLYCDLLANMDALIKEGRMPGLAGRRFAVLGVFWPSKKFAESELIPGNAAGTGDEVDQEGLAAQLDTLKGGFDAPNEVDILDAMKALLPRLKDSDSACEEFVKLARSLVQPPPEDFGDGAGPFFANQPLDVFQQLTNRVSFTQPLPPDDGTGNAAGVDGAALGAIGDFFGGIGSGARNVLNLTTYYQMKERAGLIGSTALNPILGAIAQENPALRIHLVGHSFGARLVTAAAAGTGDANVLAVHSMSLLQAAFSHYGFAQDWDGENHDGFYRRVVVKHAVKGPVIITHTISDKAVGLAYPLASLLGGQTAAGLGDEDSDYGGLGRNGAQRTPERVPGDLLRAESGKKYTFVAGKLHNLNALNSAGDLITGHGDVRNRHVAYAILSAIEAAPA